MPGLPNPNWPAMTFEVCFNVDPFDPAPPAAVWTNLTARVFAWQHQTPSGRQYELARTEAATIWVLLDNQDGALVVEQHPDRGGLGAGQLVLPAAWGLMLPGEHPGGEVGPHRRRGGRVERVDVEA